jgi:16S rRNA (adenine1518-N6/adenine1519-N6)-dimethyltransferase
MSLLQETKDLCNLYHIKPTRSRGQNFLINEKIYDKIIEAADLRKTDKVLEVGPGLGFLTFALAAQVKEVVAVELDRGLAEVLRTRLPMQGIKNVQVIQDNILDFAGFLSRHSREGGNPGSSKKFQQTTVGEGIKILGEKKTWMPASAGMTEGKYKIVANLPYNITSIFLRKFLEGNFKPASFTLMLQKEVAERITARAGDMSLLALSVQFFAQAKIVAPVSKRDFWPAPEVDSAIIHLQVTNDNKKIDQKLFFRLARIGFSAKRKMLKNNLANGLKISATETQNMLVKAGLNPLTRAEDLGLDDWLKLLGLVKQRDDFKTVL